MGFKEENYTPKGLRTCILLWMMIICNHTFAQTAPHCPIRVDLEPKVEQEASAANNYSQNLFPFFNSWQNINNLRLSDNNYATVSLDPFKRSTMIFGNNASFSIPNGAEISGLEIQIEGHTRGQGYTEDLLVQLLDNNGQRIGDNKTLTALPTDMDWLATSDSTDVIWTYGGIDDKWGLDLNEYIINNPNFGYALQVRNKLGANVDVLVDNIQIIIHYTPLYRVCLDHACVPFYVDDSEDPLVSYEWYIPQGWELISDSEHDEAINIGPSYATFGTYEICVESFYAEDPTGICCRNFNYEDCNPGMISGLVFLDQNGNFQRDNEDILESNTIVNLYDSNGVLISTTSTDNDGAYSFQTVFQGNYYIQVESAEGKTFVLSKIGTPQTDSDIDNSFGPGTTDLISVDPGQEITNIDAGLSNILSIGDFIWEDINGDGIQQEDEPGIKGVTVTISNSLLGSINTESDENGFYSIENLPSSDYLLDFFASEEFVNTSPNQGTSDLDSDYGGSPILISYPNGGIIDSLDAGFFSLGSIGDYVWDDLNKNGLQDSTELGIPGVKLYLKLIDGTIVDSTITGDNGNYLFSEIPPGEYIVEVEIDDIYTLTINNNGTDISVDSDGVINNGIINSSPITITSGLSISDIDFGFFVQPVNIFGITWLDSNNDGQYQTMEPFLDDVDVILFDELGNQVNNTKSDLGGFFEFQDENPGTYYIQFSSPDGFFFTIPNIGDDISDSDVDGTNGIGTTSSFTLLPGETSSDIASGYQAFPSISGITWEDINGDGIRQNEDSFLENIIVNLRSEDGTLVESDTTNINGVYEFAMLNVGNYYIEFIGEGFEHTTHIADTPFNSDVTGDLGLGTTSIFTIVGNQLLTDIDAGFFSLGVIGDYIWEDLNNDGIQDIDEQGLAGVIVSILDNQQVILSSIETDGTGLYLFENLTPGNYSINVDPQSIYTITEANQGDDELDSDGQLINGNISSGIINIQSRDTFLNYDFGFIQIPADVGGITWLDSNNDGQYQEEEPYLSNIEVFLYNDMNVLIDQTVSNLAGFYNFPNIIAGEYYIQFDLPDGHIFTIPNVGTDISDSDVNSSIINGSTELFLLNPGDINMSISAGYQTLPKVGDYVWIDNNRDGLQNSEESGLNGVTVTLFDANNMVVSSTVTDNNPETGSPGFYLFDTLEIGDYYIQFEKIDTLDFTESVSLDETLNSDINGENQEGTTSTFTLVGNQCNLDIDGGYTLIKSNISGEVWVDSDKDGIQNSDDLFVENITVRLFNANNMELETTTTNESGKYLFAELDEGDYYIVFDTIERYTPTIPFATPTLDIDSDLDNSQAVGSTNIISLVNGVNVDNIDAGFIDGAGIIAGLTWIDANNNGLLDFQESTLDSIEVKLFSIDSLVIDSVMVDENGIYAFEEILPGDYFLIFENQDPTFFNVEANQGDDNFDDDVTNTIAVGSTDTISIEFFEDIAPVNAGYYQLAAIGDMAFIDVNENGINDDEPGLDGVVVNLIHEDGTVVNSVVTSQGGGLDSGYYLIENIIPGRYSLQFIRPVFYQFIDANIGTNDTIDSDVITETTNIGSTDEFTISSGVTNTTIDAGFVFGIPTESSINGTVWDDANINGIQDSGESPRPGISVELLNSNEEVLSTQTTDNEGNYSFDQLSEGFYSIKVLGLGENETATIPNIGSDDTIDSDFFQSEGNSVESQQFFLENFEDREDVDLGIVPVINIGDFVWEDLNNTGTQEGDEPGIANLMVSITDTSGVIQQTTTTDADGKYLFSDLPAGTYQICVAIPENHFVGNKGVGISQLDSDANPDGCTDNITFTGGVDMDIDFALTEETQIEGVAFTDLNGNGINALDDPGINDIKLFLFSSTGEKLDSTVTTTKGDTTGYYSFSKLRADDYYIQFIFPDEFIFSDPNSGPDTADSDITNAFGIGTTDIIMLNSGDHIMNVDGGVYLPASIGDKVWEDLNQDGIQDEGEPGIAGIEVIIFRSFGIAIDTVITNQLGEYTFNNLKQGLYFVQFVVPQNFTLSPSNVGINDNLDSDADATGSTPLVSLAHGIDLTSVDCGIFSSMASLRSVVWEDLNGDGLRQPTEARIPDIRVTLFDDDNNAIKSTVSNALGLYAFQGIPVGEYKVFVDLDGTDYEFTSIDMASNDMLDSDIYQNGESDVFTSAAVLSVPNIDVGLFETGSIEGIAWNDQNQDGIYDLEESIIPGVKVRLYDHQNQMVADLYTTSDDASNIFFSNLRPGMYHMEYKFDKDLEASMIGTDETAYDNNSDIRQEEGIYKSPIFEVTSAHAVTHIDAGFYKKSNGIEESITIVDPIHENESTEETVENEEPVLDGNEIQMSVHPNPATNYIVIDILNKTDAKVRVLNSNKKVVLSADADHIDQINIAHLHPGIYYIVLEQKGKSLTKKFIKVH